MTEQEKAVDLIIHIIERLKEKYFFDVGKSFLRDMIKDLDNKIGSNLKTLNPDDIYKCLVCIKAWNKLYPGEKV